jgi:hypothetical protein
MGQIAQVATKIRQHSCMMHKIKNCVQHIFNTTGVSRGTASLQCHDSQHQSLPLPIQFLWLLALSAHVSFPSLRLAGARGVCVRTKGDDGVDCHDDVPRHLTLV